MSQQRVDLSAWSEALAVVINRVGQNDFPVQLFAALAVLAPHDDPVIWLYPRGEQPFAMVGEADNRELDSSISEFLSGPYLLDPYYLAGVEERREGFFRLSELVPRTFRQSEYYRSYYARIGMIDEAGYLVAIADWGFANISFGRNKNHTRFSRAELQQLASVTAVVSLLLERHLASMDQERAGAGDDLHQHLQSALSYFGSSLLTEREREVIQLFLRGHSTKTAAEKLGISPETIKLHRKNSYAKLDVASQAELFFLFIDSLSCAGLQPGADPLKAYMASPA